MSDASSAIEQMKAKAEAKKKANAEAPEMEGFKAAKSVEKKADERPEFTLKIYSPYKVYYDEVAFSVSADNDTGAFDILPGHKNFLTLLKPCVLQIVNLRGEEKIKINRGIMHVKSDYVTVFLDV